MNTKIPYLFVAVLLFLQSCKKDRTSELPADTIHKVKAITDVSTGKAWTYEYDAQNRCIKEWKGNNQARREYTYSAGSVKEDEYDAAGSLDNTRIYEVTGEGLAVKTTYVGYAGYITRSFNSNKQRVKEIEYNSSALPVSSSDYYYTGQLLDSCVTKNGAGVTSLKSVYEYYTDFTNTTAFQNLGLSIYGKGSPLAIKKLNHYFYDYTTGVLVSEQAFTYTYEKDTQGRISKAIASGYSSASTTYTYY